MTQRQELTPAQKFDDLLADGYSLDEISYRLGWSYYQTVRHYRCICAALGEPPDEE